MNGNVFTSSKDKDTLNLVRSSACNLQREGALELSRSLPGFKEDLQTNSQQLLNAKLRNESSFNLRKPNKQTLLWKKTRGARLPQGFLDKSSSTSQLYKRPPSTQFSNLSFSSPSTKRPVSTQFYNVFKPDIHKNPFLENFELEEKGMEFSLDEEMSKSTHLTGTCMTMCSQKEAEERESSNDLNIFECLSPKEWNSDGFPKVDFEKAISKYTRSFADRTIDESDLRPVPVLHKTTEYMLKLMDNYKDVTSDFLQLYNFLEDRMRCVFQNLTCQHIRSLEAVYINEVCARFLIHSLHYLAEDSRFVMDRNCKLLKDHLIRLRELYDYLRASKESVSTPTEPEFQCYFLLKEGLDQPNLFYRTLMKLPMAVRKTREVVFACSVMESEMNYVRFFKLVRSASYLNACCLSFHFDKIRKKAIDVISESYAGRGRNFIAISKLQEWLLFEDNVHAIDYMAHFGIGCKISDDGLEGVPSFDFGQTGERTKLIGLGNPPLRRHQSSIDSKKGGLSLSDVCLGRSGTAAISSTVAHDTDKLRIFRLCSSVCENLLNLELRQLLSDSLDLLLKERSRHLRSASFSLTENIINEIVDNFIEQICLNLVKYQYYSSQKATTNEANTLKITSEILRECTETLLYNICECALSFCTRKENMVKVAYKMLLNEIMEKLVKEVHGFQKLRYFHKQVDFCRKFLIFKKWRKFSAKKVCTRRILSNFPLESSVPLKERANFLRIVEREGSQLQAPEQKALKKGFSVDANILTSTFSKPITAMLEDKQHQNSSYAETWKLLVCVPHVASPLVNSLRNTFLADPALVEDAACRNCAYLLCTSSNGHRKACVRWYVYSREPPCSFCTANASHFQGVTSVLFLLGSLRAGEDSASYWSRNEKYVAAIIGQLQGPFSLVVLVNPEHHLSFTYDSASVLKKLGLSSRARAAVLELYSSHSPIVSWEDALLWLYCRAPVLPQPVIQMLSSVYWWMARCIYLPFVHKVSRLGESVSDFVKQNSHSLVRYEAYLRCVGTCLSALASLYNFLVTKLRELFTNQNLLAINWPITEFVDQNHESLLKWKSKESIAALQESLDSLIMPDLPPPRSFTLEKMVKGFSDWLRAPLSDFKNSESLSVGSLLRLITSIGNGNLLDFTVLFHCIENFVYLKHIRTASINAVYHQQHMDNYYQLAERQADSLLQTLHEKCQSLFLLNEHHQDAPDEKCITHYDKSSEYLIKKEEGKISLMRELLQEMQRDLNSLKTLFSYKKR